MKSQIIFVELIIFLTVVTTETENTATAQAQRTPVFQNGDRFAFYDENHEFLHPLASLATGEHNPVANDDSFVTTGKGTNALYYNSMMFVFETYSY